MSKSVYFRKFVCLVIVISVFTASTLSGCGGHSAVTVDRYMPGDEKKSCATLFAEIAMIDDEIALKDQKRKDRDFWNTAEFIGGLAVIVPFFFMDSKGSHELEIEALKARQKMLKMYFAENGCSVADLSGEAKGEIIGYNAEMQPDDTLRTTPVYEDSK